jgi:hypothetical protein
MVKEEPKREIVLPVPEKKVSGPRVIEKEKPVVVNNVIDISKLSLEQFAVLLKTLNPQEKKEPEDEPVNYTSKIPQPRIEPVLEIIPEEKEPIRKTFSQKLSERALDGLGGSQFIKENYPQWSYSDWNNVKWVNERLKSYFRKLMHYSKKWIYVKDVKKLSEQVKEMMNSFYFRYLPKDYPFTDFVTDMSGKLQRVLVELEKNKTEKTRLKMMEGDYIELKSIVFEIGNTVPDVDHDKPEEKKRMNRYERMHKMRELGMTPGNYD